MGIGLGYTEKLTRTLLEKDLLFKSLRFQRIYMLHILSLKLRCLIYLLLISPFAVL